MNINEIIKKHEDLINKIAEKIENLDGRMNDLNKTVNSIKISIKNYAPNNNFNGKNVLFMTMQNEPIKSQLLELQNINSELRSIKKKPNFDKCYSYETRK